MHFRMIFGNGVGNLLENGGLARARGRNDQPTRALPDRRYEIDDSRLHEVRTCLQPEFFDWIDRGEILETNGLGVIVERHVIDAFNRSQLRTRAAVRGLSGSLNVTALA